MKKILYIHIGAPKCGSTYIQDLIKKNVNLLSNHGYLAEPWLNYEHHWSLAAYCCSQTDRQYFINSLNAFSEETYETFKANIREKLKHFEQSLKNYNSALVSSEAYFSYCSTNEGLETLKHLFLKNFDEINMILFYREPQEYLSSIYSQLVKGPQMHTSPPSDFNLADHKRTLFNFTKKLENWRNLGIPIKVTATKVGKNGLKGQELGVEFFKLIGLEPGEPLDLETNENNSSPSTFQLKLLRTRNRLMQSDFIFNQKNSYTSNFRRLTSYFIMTLPSTKKFEIDIKKVELEKLQNEFNLLDSLNEIV